MAWWWLAATLLSSCGGRVRDTAGVVCGDDVCSSGTPCVLCAPGRDPFCAERPDDAPDFWVPALECEHPDADPILTAYCDDATDCPAQTCLWWGFEAMCAEEPGTEPCGPVPVWFPACTGDADCPPCAPRCGAAPDGLLARRCE